MKKLIVLVCSLLLLLSACTAPDMTDTPPSAMETEPTAAPPTDTTASSPAPTETAAQSDNWYFYNLLDASQKAVYMCLYDNLTAYIRDNADTEPFTYTLENPDSAVDGQEIVYFMCYDHPALASYFSSFLTATKDNGSITFRDTGTPDVRVLGDITDIRRQIREIETAADSFLSDVDTSLSDYEKYLAIATKLSEETIYDQSSNKSLKTSLLDNSVYGGLINRLSVCQGFAQTYQYLCQRAGLFCMDVSGRTSVGDHAWNIIRLDDGYYHVDTTWMQSEGTRYFCLTDAQIAVDHTIISQYHPACDGAKYAYDGDKVPALPSEPTTTPSDTPKPSQESLKPSTQIDTSSPANAYKSALLDNAEFYSTDYKKNMTLSELTEAVGDDMPVRVWRFTVMDLDNDGTPEVILWLVRNQDIDQGYEVLRYDSGAMYNYSFTSRAFLDLKTDATFTVSGGAYDYGFGTMRFTKETWSVDRFASCESNYDADNNQIESYFVNQKNATAEEFQKIAEQQNEKENAVWYEFTAANIEAYLTD